MARYPEGDVRNDISDLRMLVEGCQYLDDDYGHEYVEMRSTPARIDAIRARLPDGPIRVIQIKTPAGWYQIEIGDTLVVRVLNAHKDMMICPHSSNAVELVVR